EGRVVPPDLPRRADLPPPARPALGPVGFATVPIRDLELAATLAATAEELGYSSIWVADEPGADGVEAAAAMLAATSTIGVGIGPIAPAPGRSGDLLGRLAAARLPPHRAALALEGMDCPAWSAEERQSTFSSLRQQLGPEWTLGVVSLGEATCRFAGEFADLAFLDWMTPQRIAWARQHIALGAAGRDQDRAPVRLVGRVSAVLGPGASLRLSEEALRYRAKPHYAASFAEMGSPHSGAAAGITPGIAAGAAAGIAAPGAEEAWAQAEAFSDLLDELVIHPVVKLPASASPTLGEVFYALSILLEVAHAFAPTVTGDG
ncbi:MAG TPA: LLM class flavin-dependent oxidoreductase, partial [Actinomycetota bacterium]|nr:LLM class flavin-dependent oxidoreductase [Actinomycetota bacterium]